MGEPSPRRKVEKGAPELQTAPESRCWFCGVDELGSPAAGELEGL